MVKHISHNSTHGLPKQDTDRGEDGIMSGQDTCNYSVMNFQQEYQLGAIMCIRGFTKTQSSHQGLGEVTYGQLTKDIQKQKIYKCIPKYI